MSAITQKSITGITSITTPAGVDNQFTLHNNNTTEAVKLDNAGNLHFHNHLNITGVSTASNFKTGTSNLHNTGLNVQDLDVDGHTNLDNVSISGVSTFSGAITADSTLYVGSDLTITDKIVHNGDTNTAIRFPAADTIQFETSGHDRICIKSDGKIGMGTDTPAVAIHHFSDGLNGNSLRLENREGYSLLTNDGGALHIDAGFHIFRNQAGSTEFLRIHSNGKISTGINNNSYEFTIGGLSGGPTLWLRDSTTSGTPRILFGSSEGALIGGISYNNSTDHFEFSANGVERLRIESVNSSRARFNFGAGNGDFTNPDIGGGTSGVSINKNTLGQIYACTDNADNTAANDYQTVCLNVSRRNTSGDGPQIALDRGGWIKASIAGLQGSNTATSGPGSFAIYTHNYSSGQNVRTQRFRISGSDGTVTVGDGNNLAQDYVTTMLIDGGDNSKLSLLGSSTGSGTIAFTDGSSTGAQRMAGFIQMNHTSNDNGPRLLIGQNDTSLVHIRVPGSNRGQLEVYGNFNESTTPAIEISDGGDARKVFLTNSSGDFNALTRNGSQTKGQLKMFESGILVHNMKDPDSTNVLQTLRSGIYKTTPGSTNTSLSPIVNYLQKGGSGTYDAFEEGMCTLEVNGGGNDHYQPIGFVPRGYDLDQTSFGGQWAGEMWIHQSGSQNPANYGYDSSSYNTWATMSFKCKWDCAHWNAKPSGFWVEHYINYGRAQIAKIDASGTQSQFVIYLLPGSYRIRFNCVRGMAVHRAVSDGAALVMRDGGSFVTYNTLAYSSRNTAFDSEITQGSTFQHCT